MKKTGIIGLLTLLSFCLRGYSQTAPALQIKQPFVAQTIAAGTNAVSPIYTLGAISGNFSAQIEVTGGGSVTLTYECSIDGNSFVSLGTIFSAFTATNGPAADGKDVQEFYPETSRFLRLRAEAATSNMVVTTTLAIQ